MKKYLYILTVLLLGASCAQKEQLFIDPVSTEDGKVTLEMNVTIPGVLPGTKAVAMSDAPVIENIYVAVFGSKHYLNEYSLALPVDDNDNILTDGNGKLQYLDSDGQPNKLRVILTATESTRFIHIIANGPTRMNYETTENDLMKTLTTEDGNGAYWDYFKVNGLGFRNEDDEYEPTQDAKDKFGGIQLVRNFAKIDVALDATASQTFKLLGFRVFTTPSQGTVAMYNGDISNSTPNYQNYSKWMDTAEYATMKVGGDDAEKNLLVNGKYQPFTIGSVTPEDAVDYTASTYHESGNPFFVYEREKGDQASDNRTYIILYGQYRQTSTSTWMAPSYYRIDLVDDDGNDLPIYRNFDYTVTLHSILKNGVSSAADARPSNVNISSSFSAANLSDISDGVSRLYVQYLAQTFGSSQTGYAFRYMYLPDATQDVSAAAALTLPDGAAISVHVDPEDASYQDEATAKATWESGGKKITSGANAGWYEVLFDVDADGTNKTSQFTVTGSRINDHGKEVNLFRTITIDVIKIQTVGAEVITYGSAAESPVDLVLTLESGLPASMFPIEFQISDTNQLLNPRSNDMPSGIDEDGHSYYFTRTVNWTDYCPSPGTYNYEVVCRLKRVGQGSSSIVIKHPYFNTKTVDLPEGANNPNYLIVETDAYEVKASTTNVTFSFETDQSWNATTTGTRVTPASGSGSSTVTVTLPVNTSLTESKEYTVTITTTGSDPKSKTVTITQKPLAEYTYSLWTNSTTISTGTSYEYNGITVTFGNINSRDAEYIQFNTRSNTANDRRFTVSCREGKFLKKIIPSYARNESTTSTNVGTYADGEWTAGDLNNITNVQFNHEYANTRSRLSSLEVTVLE